MYDPVKAILSRIANDPNVSPAFADALTPAENPLLAEIERIVRETPVECPDGFQLALSKQAFGVGWRRTCEALLAALIASPVVQNAAKSARPADIRTSFVNPPIPFRGHDWIAWHDGDDEESQRHGYGRTEAEAVADLLACDD